MQLTYQDHSRGVAGLTYVYPVLSRRAGGVSIGINLNPNNACNWHCAYCQVEGLVRGKAPEINRQQLKAELGAFLHELVHGDYLAQHLPEGQRDIRDIAFSGNGEPTSADEFADIVADVGMVRDAAGLQHVPIRLITNGSQMGQPDVIEGLRRLAALGGEVWFKLDGGRPEDWLRVNGVTLKAMQVRANLQRCAQACPTWVQSCFFRWEGDGVGEAALQAYLEIIDAVSAQNLCGVHLYGVARPSMQPEAVHISQLAESELQAIADRLREKGLTVTVSP